jgi:hypothetical protein
MRRFFEVFTRGHGWFGSRSWVSLQTVAYGNALTEDFDTFRKIDNPKGI